MCCQAIQSGVAQDCQPRGLVWIRVRLAVCRSCCLVLSHASLRLTASCEACLGVRLLCVLRFLLSPLLSSVYGEHIFFLSLNHDRVRLCAMQLRRQPRDVLRDHEQRFRCAKRRQRAALVADVAAGSAMVPAGQRARLCVRACCAPVCAFISKEFFTLSVRLCFRTG